VRAATLKVHVGGERSISTAEGHGPVNALDSVLRQAIARKYPYLSDMGPLDAGAVAELPGMDRKAVDKAMAELKKDGCIESPRRCFWAPAG